MDNSSGSRVPSSGTPNAGTAGPGTTSSETGQGGSWSPVWYGIGAVVFVALLAFLFVIFGSRSVRRDYYSSPPPGGAATSPAP
jgi:hypothetical protein